MFQKIASVIKSLFTRRNPCETGSAGGAVVTADSSSANEAGAASLSAGTEGPSETEAGKTEDDPWGCFCSQIGLYNFTTEKGSIGFYLDPENRWVKLAHKVFLPGMEQVYEDRMRKLSGMAQSEVLRSRLSLVDASPEAVPYQLELKGIDMEVERHLSQDAKKLNGNPDGGRDAYPFRAAFGSLVVKGILGLSDRGTSEIIRESPYLQWFLGFEEWSPKNTVHPSSLVHFRKRMDMDTMKKINEIAVKEAMDAAGLLADAKAGTGIPTGCGAATGTTGSTAGKDAQDPAGEDGGSAPDGNKGTLILDATCGPVHIRYPQDFSLLDEARSHTDDIISEICRRNESQKPRTYCKTILKEAVNLSKSKKKTEDNIRHVILLELNSIKRNLEYIDKFVSDGVSLTADEVVLIKTVRELYAQQKYMYENRVHTVSDRIVSIDMPFIRPINRGKVNCPTEFGPKFDLGVDEAGYSRIEYFSYGSYNESSHLTTAVEGYKERTGHYPECILADKIYRTKANRDFCKGKGIRLSGPALGRKPQNEEKQKAQEELERQDMVDRISVERHFSREKRCFGIDPIMTRTYETVGHTIGMAVFLDNMIPVGF